MIIELRPSPNHNARPVGCRVSLVVIHGTAGTDAGDLEWLTSPKSQVSAHYLIQRTGHTYRLVEESRRAWHAGVGSWKGHDDVNDISIGIELSGTADQPFTPAQYRALGGLLAGIADRHGLTMRDVVGHYHVAPGRKTDPWALEWGRVFDEMNDAWGGPRPAA